MPQLNHKRYNIIDNSKLVSNNVESNFKALKI